MESCDAYFFTYLTTVDPSLQRTRPADHIKLAFRFDSGCF